MNFPFERGPADGMILVAILLDGHTKMTVMLDTGASVSTFDSTELIVSGYDLSKPIGIADVETAIGMLQVDVFELHEFTAFGITRKKHRIQVYDFLAHGVLSEYQGILGMDFFEGTKFCIDTVRNQITIEPILV
jgi:Aspartyl protease